MFQKRKKVKKKSLFILFSCLAVSGCLTWLTVWCNTSYPSFDYAPVEEPDYSEAKTYLMTTNALLESTLAQSIDAIITQSGTVKHYFEVWQHYVPWLEEFLNRKDVGEIVYEAYQNIKKPERLYLLYPEAGEWDENYDRLQKLTLLLAHPNIQKTMTKEQKATFPWEILKKRHWETSNYQTYGNSDDKKYGYPGYDFPIYLYYGWNESITSSELELFPTYEKFGHVLWKTEKGWKRIYDKIYKESGRFRNGSYNDRLFHDGVCFSTDTRNPSSL